MDGKDLHTSELDDIEASTTYFYMDKFNKNPTIGGIQEKIFLYLAIAEKTTFKLLKVVSDVIFPINWGLICIKLFWN